jgi:hypothetical protein
MCMCVYVGMTLTVAREIVGQSTAISLTSGQALCPGRVERAARTTRSMPEPRGMMTRLERLSSVNEGRLMSACSKLSCLQSGQFHK